MVDGFARWYSKYQTDRYFVEQHNIKLEALEYLYDSILENAQCTHNNLCDECEERFLNWAYEQTKEELYIEVYNEALDDLESDIWRLRK